MEKNLFEQARDMMTNLTTNKDNNQGHIGEDKEAVQKAIQAAYNDATPEEISQLEHFEQQINEKM